MVMLLIFTMLIGAVLGMRFKVLVLVPATALVVLLIAAAGIAHGDGAGVILLAMVLAAVGLQMGYLGGTGTRFAMAAARAPRLRSHGAPAQSAR